MTRETVTKTTIRCDFCQEICSGEDYKIRVVMGYVLADPTYIEGELRSYIPYAKQSHDICKKCVDKALKRHLGIEESDKLIAAAPEMYEAVERFVNARNDWIHRRDNGDEDKLGFVEDCLEDAQKELVFLFERMDRGMP